MFMILTLIVLVAALNIVSGLIMLVKDKGSDIAILRTMGATSGAVMRIFFMTGAAIGIVGTFAGVALGVVVCLNIESIRQFFSWISGTTIFNPELYFLSQLPADMNPARPSPSSSWRWRCRSSPPSSRPGVPRASIRCRRCATNDAAIRNARHKTKPRRHKDPPMTKRVALQLTGVERHYPQGETFLSILKGADFALHSGETVALVAPSGTGKSTLLQIAGLLEKPDGGEVKINGLSCGDLADDKRTAIAATRSASSTSSTICCRNSPRSKTS